MIRTSIVIAAGATVVAFAAGCYVGWRTTLFVMDSIVRRANAQSAK